MGEGGKELFDAALRGDLDKVKALRKEHGDCFDVEWKHPSSRWSDGTPLHAAALMGQAAVVSFLVEACGANVNARNMSKVTPVTAFDDTTYNVGPITRRARQLYWDWAASNG